jgi:hypothetical protein
MFARLARLGFFALLPLFVAGCAAASSPYMQPVATSAAPTAPGDAALVTFVRHDGSGGILYTIMDERVQFVGQIAASSRFTATYAPGEHVFVTWNDEEPTTGAAAFGLIGAAVSAATGELPHVEPLRATLAAGKAYVIEVGSNGRWHVLRQGEAAFVDTAPYAPNTMRGQAFFAQSQERVEGIRKKAMDQLQGYGGEDLASHTLRAEDGR